MSIKSKDLIAQAKTKNQAALAEALKSGDGEKMAAAMAAFATDIQDAVLQEAAREATDRNRDESVLIARGQRALTGAEMHYYNGLIEAMQSGDPKMALVSYEVAMPETIIESVIGTIQRTHPLLDRITMHNTSYLTRMVMNAQAVQLAQWGKIDDKVTKEISGKLKEIDVTMCKLTAFLLISNDILELGPAWIDRYVQEILAESIAMALEVAVVTGSGKDQPIGMIRDVADDVTITGGEYPKKTAIKLTDLSPTSLGGVVSKIAADPLDATAARVIPTGDLIMVVNAFDYWEKIMPATCYQKNDGTWVHDILPIPADIIQSAALARGEGALGMASHYFLGLGVHGKRGTITKDESVKFLDDQTAYKAKLQGNGRPMDNNAFQYLDVSGLTVPAPKPEPEPETKKA